MEEADFSKRFDISYSSAEGVFQPVDVADLDVTWNNLWAAVPPVARLLRARFADRWVRFNALPNAKRYATSDAERAEVLRRYHALLEPLIDDVLTGAQGLVVVTCSWSSTPVPVERDRGVATIVPEAVHWRSDNLATEPGFQSWQHHYVSRLTTAGLDRLLVFVANDLTDGVIVTNDICSWVLHPFDGGAELFAGSSE